MRDTESIEAMLARLMPTAISEEGQRSMDEMLDDLYGEETEVPPKKVVWKLVTTGIAAALALFFAVQFQKPNQTTDLASLADDEPGMVLMGESDRIEKMTDEGWMADSEGTTLQAVRVHATEENTLRDERTGIEVRISQPREELLLFPVNAF